MPGSFLSPHLLFSLNFAIVMEEKAVYNKVVGSVNFDSCWSNTVCPVVYYHTTTSSNLPAGVAWLITKC
jgi:hypothetical protein